jgi:hypothetical protein
VHGLVGHLVEETTVLQRGDGLRGDAGQPVAELVGQP